MTRPEKSSGRESRVLIGCGPRAAEELLFSELVPAGAPDLSHLAVPVRVVVPSKSLRGHLLRALVRRRGAVAGVVVQTAFGAAVEIIERAGGSVPRGDAAFEVIVRRLAREESDLSSFLDDLQDGYAPVVGVVRDLLDAGFNPYHEDGVLERVENLPEPLGRGRRRRAGAVVRVAARAYEAMEATGWWRSAQAFEIATNLLGERGPEVLPASQVLVHGFADVTGLVADFLTALARSLPTSVILDRPADPADREREDPGVEFLERLEGKLQHLGRTGDTETEERPEITVIEAADADDEARWVADRVRELLDGGLEPESIGIVCRNFEGLAYAFRRHLWRLGVPFSGLGENVPGAGPQRAVRRLVVMLRGEASAPVDVWIESTFHGARRAGLLAGMRQLGVRRLSDAAEIEIDGSLGKGLRLPLDLRVDSSDETEIERPLLPASEITEARERASQLLAVFESWPARADAAAHRDASSGALAALGWEGGSESAALVNRCLGSLEAELSPGLKLDRSEWIDLLTNRLSDVGEDPVGGVGGGVALLSVVEARARTFEHLFVVGLNRDVFPRVIRDDAVLPDVVRMRLASDVLPEMPVRARGAVEERFLFAQLMDAAPSVHVSWRRSGRDAPMAPSPFVSSAIAGGAVELDPAPRLWAVEPFRPGFRPPYEHAVLAALGARREDLAAVLAEALSWEKEDQTWTDAEHLAGARLELLNEIEPESSEGGMSPFFGFVGAAFRGDEEGDWVTRVEDVVACPWSAFVRRRLGIRPMPDPHIGLPNPRGQPIGDIVHRVLARIVLEALQDREGSELAAFLDRPPAVVPWPDADRFERLLTEAARDVAREAGFSSRGMSRLLAARARPYLEIARSVEWGPDDHLPAVLAAEAVGEVHPGEKGRRLRFRADRVDAGDDSWWMVDYKTGKPPFTQKSEDKRHDHLLMQITRGRMLQAAAYALVAPKGGSRGRYLWLSPHIGDAPAESRTATVSGDETCLAAAVEGAVRAVTAAQSCGAAFPRVEEVGTTNVPDHCRFCEVSEPCLRSDSELRNRIVAWMNREEGVDRAEAAARALWHLGTGTESGS